MSQLVLGGIKHLDRRLTDIERRIHAPIYGVYWDKGPDPTLIRTHDAVGMEAAVGVDGEWVHNDFDRAEIFGEMGPVTDEYGNTFIRIPKFYIRKTDGPGYKTWAVSKHPYPGFYLPWCFWDFEREKSLPYIDVGKYKASLGDGSRLESKPGVHPLVLANIVAFRNYANNNNVGGLKGYQQLDVHTYDVIRTLMFIEFATLNMQEIMAGFTEGQYSGSHTAAFSETQTNRIILTNSNASGFRVGQSIGVGTDTSNNSVSGGSRLITGMLDYDNDHVAIYFDGEPIDVAEGNVVANRGWINGFSDDIAASSGTIVANDGKYPCMYRGIESPYGDIWQWVDGVNINNRQAWVCADAEDYASNLFATPYEKLGYINADSNGYVKVMGFDRNHPFAEFCVDPSGSSSTYYSDYYDQNTGQRVARVGGYWATGVNAGPSFWALHSPSSFAYVYIGGRLLKKAL